MQRRTRAGARHRATRAVQLALDFDLAVHVLGEVRLVSAHQLVLAGRGLRGGTSRASRSTRCSRRAGSLTGIRQDEALGLRGGSCATSGCATSRAPGAPAPLVPVAAAESACRQPVTVMVLLLLSSFCARSLRGRSRPRARRWSRGILRRARWEPAPRGRHSDAAARTDPNRMFLFIYMPSRFSVVRDFIRTPELSLGCVLYIAVQAWGRLSF